MRTSSRRILHLVLLVIVAACARSPIREVGEALEPVSRPSVDLSDDLNLAGLEPTLRETASILQERPRNMTFGRYRVPSGDYGAELAKLADALKNGAKSEAFFNELREHWAFLRVYGNEKGAGQVFVTGYFAPKILGSLKPTGEFRQPLYAMPDDMALVDADGFAKVRSGAMGKARDRWIPARVVMKGKGRPPEVVPYFNREEIDARGALAKRGLELVYVDPIDSFFLQIQGSGIVQLMEGGQRVVGYAGQNGHPYVPIGKFMTDVIPLESMSQQTIEAHLRSLAPAERQRMLNMNPSYVFFKPLDKAPVTYSGAAATGGRTIATDNTYFPKGALALLSFEKPEFDPKAAPGAAEHVPTGTSRVSRLVMDHDTGGAIRGPGRVDLYWGEGADARQSAGVLKGPGELYFLLPKTLLK